MTRKTQKEKTKERLLQAAYQEFATQGIYLTKTLDIAKAAGVAHGTIFIHFPTREDLLREVVQDFGMKIGQCFKKALDKEGSLRDILAAHLKILQQYEAFYTRILIEMASLPKEIKNHIVLIQSGIAYYLNQSIEKSHKFDPIRPLPLPFVLNTWLGLIHYYLMNRDLFAPGQSVIEVRGKELLTQFINLVTRESSL